MQREVINGTVLLVLIPVSCYIERVFLTFQNIKVHVIFRSALLLVFSSGSQMQTT